MRTRHHRRDHAAPIGGIGYRGLGSGRNRRRHRADRPAVSAGPRRAHDRRQRRTRGPHPGRPPRPATAIGTRGRRRRPRRHGRMYRHVERADRRRRTDPPAAPVQPRLHHLHLRLDRNTERRTGHPRGPGQPHRRPQPHLRHRRELTRVVRAVTEFRCRTRTVPDLLRKRSDPVDRATGGDRRRPADPAVGHRTRHPPDPHPGNAGHCRPRADLRVAAGRQWPALPG